MSFFDDTKNAGLLLLIIALMDIVFVVISAFITDAYKDAEMWKKIVLIVGGVIEGLFLAVVGMGIMKGSCMFQLGGFFSDVTSKFGVLVAGTTAYGIGTIISGVFTTIAFGGGIFDIVLGVLIVLVAWLMLDGGKVANNIIWIILLIIYIIGIIISAIACLVLVGIPSLLLFIMLLLFLLSPEVKQKMGM